MLIHSCYLIDFSLSELQTHKIKLGYKSLAAIPTNTLLLDQQVSSLVWPKSLLHIQAYDTLLEV